MLMLTLAPAFGLGSFGIAAAAIFLGLLLAASVADARHRRIPNGVVLALLATGLAVSVSTAGLAGLGRSLLAVLVGLVIWLPFYVFRRFGAGDVKLFSAAAAWLTPLAVVDAAFVSAFVGGALSVVWLLRESGVRAGIIRVLHAARYRQTLVQTTDRRSQLPYGVALSIGLSLCFFGIGFFK